MQMETTRQVARRVSVQGDVDIMQKGQVLDPTMPFKGPIRLKIKENKKLPPSKTSLLLLI